MAAKSREAKAAANVRKQIKRRIDKYVAERKHMRGAERRATTETIKELRNAYKAAQVGRGKSARTKQGKQQFWERMAYAKNVVKQAPLVRRNVGSFLETQRQINLASRKGGENLSQYSEAQIKVFYRVTEKIWTMRGKSLDDIRAIQGQNRNLMIMRAVGANSLEEAVDIVLSSDAAKTDLNNMLGKIDTMQDMSESEYRESMRLLAELMETDMGSENADGLVSPIETRVYITV